MNDELRPIPMKWTGTTVILTLSGELDLVVADDLDLAMRELADSSATRIVLDVSQLEFADAVGVRALVRARDVAAASGRTLVVTKPTPAVARVLDMTGAGDLIARLEER